jgi:hypothetical protein
MNERQRPAPETTYEDEVDLEGLLKKSGIGTRSYPEVIPALIKEIMRLRREIRNDRIWNATRDMGRIS